MRPVGVRNYDIPQVAQLATHMLDDFDDESGVGVVKCVDQGETNPIIDKKGVHSAALFLAKREEPVTDLPEMVFRIHASTGAMRLPKT
jgi:hypothetical protein